MELEYWHGDTSLDSIMLVPQHIEELEDFIDSVTPLLEMVNLRPEEISYFYKRNKDGESILGIQLDYTSNTDISNYLVFDCRATISGNCAFPNYDMHFKGKISKVANPFANMILDNVNNFFSDLEQNLYMSGITNKEYDVMRVVTLTKKKMGLLKKLFGRNKNVQ